MTATALHDFDFLIGRWAVTHRRLVQRLQGSDAWETFSSTGTVWALPGGVSNFDTLVAEDWRPGWVGMSYRIYHPPTDRWSIYWMTNDGGGMDAASGRLDPPVVGRFQGDEGVFEGEDRIDGRPVRVRYRWLRRGPAAARWEQAFSADGGQSWETNWVMDFERLSAEMVPLGPTPTVAPATEATAVTGHEVVELRQYTLHPGRRDALVELFDREFVETQEAVGMAVLGQFRDLDAPDRFVWLRGFESLAARGPALAAFYDGPVWQRHRDGANATMVDSDDVRLLRPAWPGAGLPMAGCRRAAGPVRMALPRPLSVCVLPLREPAGPALRQVCRETISAQWTAAGAQVLGWYVTEPAPNDFPRLPVREGEPVVVGIAAWPAGPAPDATAAGWRALEPLVAPWLAGPVQWLRLCPTARSALPG
ncbi:NIPSNAP family protein [Ideonella sp.]|uniref:NIPSNAP family protein n=1 Tax=Ideonella sp. TaxID=1929293 RepID=UPI0035B09F1F